MSELHKGKTVVVTGAGNGIGKAIAIRFAKEGANVVVNDIDGPIAEEVAKEILDAGGSSLAINADVSDNSQVSEMFQKTVERYGPVDVLVNNAGLVSPMLHFFEADESWWRRIIDVNLTGHFLCSQHAARMMAKKGSGVIINMSSDRKSVV